VSRPPPRPLRRERSAYRLFRWFAPRLPPVEASPPPPALAPFEELAIERRGRSGRLAATVFPASAEPRGTVLFLHPWMEWGASYFYRRNRLPAARAAGYEAWTFDLSGFRGSSPADGFFDRDVDAALDAIEQRASGRPVFVWGVSSGGYWAHVALSRRDGVAAAFFEDVSAHLLEWSWRVMPLWRPSFATFRLLFPEFYRWLDIRRHAPHLRLRAAAYASGELDSGVRPEDTRTLAAAAGAEHRIVAGAGHLEGIKRDPEAIISLALETFDRGAV
jgi:pimeloyl-ACP methyl ester carboxylesterase